MSVPNISDCGDQGSQTDTGHTDRRIPTNRETQEPMDDSTIIFFLILFLTRTDFGCKIKSCNHTVFVGLNPDTPILANRLAKHGV